MFRCASWQTFNFCRRLLKIRAVDTRGLIVFLCDRLNGCDKVASIYSRYTVCGSGMKLVVWTFKAARCSGWGRWLLNNGRPVGVAYGSTTSNEET